MHDPVRIGAALIPLGIYCLLLGVLNLGRRPYLVSLARDTAALGMGLAGVFMVGPIEMIAPDNAFRTYGPFVWLMLLTLYSLLVTLVVLVQRPGLVIYNLTLDEFRPILGQVVATLEPDPRWAASTLSMPSLGIELHVETFAPLSNVKLTSVGDHQSISGWRKLEDSLAAALRSTPVRPSPIGVTFILVALLAGAGVSYAVAQDPQVVRKAFEQLMKFR